MSRVSSADPSLPFTDTLFELKSSSRRGGGQRYQLRSQYRLVNIACQSSNDSTGSTNPKPYKFVSIAYQTEGPVKNMSAKSITDCIDLPDAGHGNNDENSKKRRQIYTVLGKHLRTALGISVGHFQVQVAAQKKRTNMRYTEVLEPCSSLAPTSTTPPVAIEEVPTPGM